TGELPFRGNQRMLLHQVQHDEPKPPRRLNDRLPRDLETICLKAMAKEPHRRYAGAQELAADLRRYLDGLPIQARPVRRLERLWRWCRRNPRLAAANLVAALLTTVLALGSTIAAWIYRDQRNGIQYEQEWTKVALRRAERAERKVRLELGKTLLAEGA